MQLPDSFRTLLLKHCYYDDMSTSDYNLPVFQLFDYPRNPLSTGFPAHYLDRDRINAFSEIVKTLMKKNNSDTELIIMSDLLITALENESVIVIDYYD